MKLAEIQERAKSRPWGALYLAVKIVLYLYLATVATLWASTNKTLFWSHWDIASVQSVTFMVNEFSAVKNQLDSLSFKISKLDTSIAQLTNGRLYDLYDLNIRNSGKFTYEEKMEIMEGVFPPSGGPPTIGLDSLRIIIRKRLKP